MIPTHHPRNAERTPVQCPIYYSDGKFQSSGTVENLTPAGGRVRGSHPVQKGMELIVILLLPDPRPALVVRHATVRWTNGRAFGIALTELDLAAQAELTRLATAQLPGLWASLN